MPKAESLADRIDSLLPQTQCTKCGFDGCRPYADAIAAGQADINRCPPGGQANIRRLAALVGRPERALDPAFGSEGPRRIAWIDPQRCIGCTRCIPACPVDAIIGAPKFLHAVITSDCTGCDLCLSPCPVDCIEMRPVAADEHWSEAMADAARRRHQAHRQRAGERQDRRDGRLASTTTTANATTDARPAAIPANSTEQRKRAMLAAVAERARRNLSQRKTT